MNVYQVQYERVDETEGFYKEDIFVVHSTFETAYLEYKNHPYDETAELVFIGKHVPLGIFIRQENDQDEDA